MHTPETQFAVLGRTFTDGDIKTLLATPAEHGLAGYRKVLALVARHADQLYEAGVEVREGEGADLCDGTRLEARITDGPWRTLVTTRLQRTSPATITDDERILASVVPSPIYAGDTRMYVLLPSDGERIRAAEVEVNGQRRSTPLLPVPSLFPFFRPLPPGVGTPQLGDHILVDARLKSLADVMSLLSRDEGIGETDIFTRSWRPGAWPGMITRLLPRKFIRDGEIQWIPGDLLATFTGKDGAFRHVADVRVPGGGTLVLLADAELGVDSCRVPETWAHEHHLWPGDWIVLGRRPFSVIMAVQVQGLTAKTLALHPSLIDTMFSDCDGDGIQHWAIPQGIDTCGIRPSVLLADVLPVHAAAKTSRPWKGVVDYRDAEHAGAGMASVEASAGNKLRIGSVTNIKYQASRLPAFQGVPLGTLDFDTASYERVLGRPLQRSTRPAEAYQSLLLWWCEDTINKHVGAENLAAVRLGLDRLNDAHDRPFATWLAFLGYREHDDGTIERVRPAGKMGLYPDQLAEWCEYLATLPAPFEGLLAEIPAAVSMHERPNVPDALAVLDTPETMFDGLR